MSTKKTATKKHHDFKTKKTGKVKPMADQREVTLEDLDTRLKALEATVTEMVATLEAEYGIRKPVPPPEPPPEDGEAA